jgi:HEAT repeat protein
MMVLAFPEIEPRWRWIRSRGRWGLAALMKAVEKNSSDYARNGCAKILGELGAQKALPTLGQAFLTDSSDHVRLQAACSMLQIDKEAALAYFLKSAAQGLDCGKLSLAAESKNIFPAVRDLLIASPKCRLRDVAQDARFAEIVPDLLAYCQNTGDLEIQWNILQHLIFHGEPRAAPLLAQFWPKSKSKFQREEILRGLRIVGGDEVSSLLIGLLKANDSHSEKGKLLEALADTGDKNAVPFLMARAEESELERDEFRAALTLATKTADPRAIPWLLRITDMPASAPYGYGSEEVDFRDSSHLADKARLRFAWQSFNRQ